MVLTVSGRFSQLYSEHFPLDIEHTLSVEHSSFWPASSVLLLCLAFVLVKSLNEPPIFIDSMVFILTLLHYVRMSNGIFTNTRPVLLVINNCSKSLYSYFWINFTWLTIFLMHTRQVLCQWTLSLTNHVHDTFFSFRLGNCITLLFYGTTHYLQWVKFSVLFSITSHLLGTNRLLSLKYYDVFKCCCWQRQVTHLSYLLSADAFPKRAMQLDGVTEPTDDTARTRNPLVWFWRTSHFHSFTWAHFLTEANPSLVEEFMKFVF